MMIPVCMYNVKQREPIDQAKIEVARICMWSLICDSADFIVRFIEKSIGS